MKIPYGRHFIDRLDILSVSKALRENFITQGPIIEKFEKKICKIVKCKYAVALSSCSAGLHLAVASIKKNKNKNKIITSPISFVSTANAILHNNYKPTFLDIDRQSLNLNVENIEKYLKKEKKINAMITVHLGGLPAHSIKLHKLSKARKIFLIEDAAHSFGAKYEDGSLVGSCKYSDVTVFSSHPVKTITTGEGGIVTTNSKKIYESLIKLRSHGVEKNFKRWKNKKLGFTNHKKNQWYYEAQEIGYNYRITDFQCALGISQLRKLKKIIVKRKKIADFYDKNFRLLKNIYIPQFQQRNDSSNHLYILNINFNNLKINKNTFMSLLEKKKIITQVHYIPIPLHPLYKNLGYNIKNLIETKKYYETAISIPIFYSLTMKLQKKIIFCVRQIINKYSR